MSSASHKTKERQILTDFDLEKGYYPKGFDRRAALQRAAELKSEIERTFSEQCDETNPEHIQDGCYHAEIILPQKLSLVDWRPSIRLCNFGNMIAISNESNLTTGSLEKLISIFERRGFNFVSESTLLNPYDGSKRGVDTWWQRYFDFL